jgi:uncharacterized protein (DUF2147 family)
MRKLLEAKSTISQLIRKIKAWLGWCMLLAVAFPLSANAEPGLAEGRYAYAKVFIEGTGMKHDLTYMRDVYLDVAAIPVDAVVEQDSGILFTDSNYKKSLSEIQVRALEFVEPHVKELGFETVSDYQVFVYPGDKGKTHLDRAAVERLRADSFDVPSKLTGPKAELHGAWMGGKAEAIEAKPAMADKNTEMPAESPKAENAPAAVATQKATSAADAAKAKAVAKKKKRLEEKRKSLAKMQAEDKNATEENATATATANDEKEATQKAGSNIVKERIFDDSLSESQAKTWCSRIVPQFLKSMETSNNKLISMGECSCKLGLEPGSAQQNFQCGFPVTYRVLAY